MAPVLAIFLATFRLGKRTCPTWIRIHVGIQTLLLLCDHCQELAIVPQDFPKPIFAYEKKASAIREFTTPANLTDLRLFMGLVNHLAEFLPGISATVQSLRPLMNPKRRFLWTPQHEEKKALFRPSVLAPFDPPLPTILMINASCLYGVGRALFQDHGGGILYLVQCSSCFWTPKPATPL